MMKTATLALAFAGLLGTAALAHPGNGTTDPQIAHIVYTAGLIDIAASKQALAKSKNPRVRAFAQEMVRDHEAVNKQALVLVGKLKVTPEPNPTSASLSKQGEQKLRELGRLRGAAFDRTYVQNEVAYHKTVNGALGGTLIPGAHNAELKELLQTGHRLFQEHQLHAEHLAQSLRAPLERNKK